MAPLARRESMENGAMWERKVIKGKLEIPDPKESRGCQDQKETKDLQKKKSSSLFLKYVAVGVNAKRLRWSCCL